MGQSGDDHWHQLLPSSFVGPKIRLLPFSMVINSPAMNELLKSSVIFGSGNEFSHYPRVLLDHGVDEASKLESI